LLANWALELGIRHVVLIAYQDYGTVEDCPQTHHEDCGATNLVEVHLQDLMNLARPNTTIKIGVETNPAALPDKVNFGFEEINHATAVDHVKKAVALVE